MDYDLLRALDVFLAGAEKPLVAVVGPTASGKTSLSMEIAAHAGGEIINADSRQLYRLLDIGTAKITKEEMRGVAHHLIDVKNPDEEVTVGWFQEQALGAIDDIHGRGNVPILVGGSMLYVSSIVDGMTLASPADRDARLRIEAEYDRDGGKTLYEKLQKTDPGAAAGIHRNNKPYVVRAMEIYEAHGMPKAEVVKKRGCAYELLMFGVDMPRDVLIKRIGERVDAMFASGWIGEVRELMRLGYGIDDPGMKSCGYKEIIRYIEEVESGGSDADADAALELLKRAVITKTGQYAKRQMTWWRNDKRVRWVGNRNPVPGAR